jgi:hypothetical protein
MILKKILTSQCDFSLLVMAEIHMIKSLSFQGH